jgi:predicted anti-sigma-YlaC factor YlaD
MACEQWREMLSAQLDGEDDPVVRPLVDEHLVGCAGCRAWLDRAATVNRLTRTGLPVPDLGDRILATLPGLATAPVIAARRPLSERLRPGAPVLLVALAVVGAVQLILGLGQVGGGVTGAHVHAGLDATPGHLWHESAAWNAAVGAGYLFIALRRTRPTGLVPMLTAFVGMLLLLSINDLTGGRVDSARLVSHGFVILGYLLIVTLSRLPGGFASPPGVRAEGDSASGWRARFAGEEPGDTLAPALRPGLRLVPPGPMIAEHQERRAA